MSSLIMTIPSDDEEVNDSDDDDFHMGGDATVDVEDPSSSGRWASARARAGLKQRPASAGLGMEARLRRF